MPNFLVPSSRTPAVCRCLFVVFVAFIHSLLGPAFPHSAVSCWLLAFVISQTPAKVPVFGCLCSAFPRLQRLDGSRRLDPIRPPPLLVLVIANSRKLPVFVWSFLSFPRRLSGDVCGCGQSAGSSSIPFRPSLRTSTVIFVILLSLSVVVTWPRTFGNYVVLRASPFVYCVLHSRIASIVAFLAFSPFLYS